MRDDKEPVAGVVLVKYVVVLSVLLHSATARQFAEVIVLRAREEGNVVGSEVLQQSLFRADGGRGGGEMIDDNTERLVWVNVKGP